MMCKCTPEFDANSNDDILGFEIYNLAKSMQKTKVPVTIKFANLSGDTRLTVSASSVAVCYCFPHYCTLWHNNNIRICVSWILTEK